MNLTTLTQVVPAIDAESIGAAIRRRRRRMALSLDDVCDRAGISKAYLSSIERGVVPPPRPAMLAAIEEVLGLDALALFILIPVVRCG